MGESMIKNKDIPVPTWFVGYAADDYSVSYWKGVNGCESRGVNGVFSQAKDYTPWQTQYAGPISKVVVTSVRRMARISMVSIRITPVTTTLPHTAMR